MIGKIKERVYRSEPFARLLERSGSIESAHPLRISGVSGSLLAFVASSISEELGRQVVLIVADEGQAEKVRDDCALLVGEENARLFGHDVAHRAKLLDMSSRIARVETLAALLGHKPVLVLTSATSLATPVPPPHLLSERKFEITSGHVYPFEQLLEKLTALGFERKEFVEEYGDFAVRGGILDIFPFVGENPIRLEFWGDTAESIREFDLLSQRSIRTLQSASIIANLTSGAASTVNLQPPTANLTTTPGPIATLFEYLQPNALVILNEPVLIEKEVEELAKEGVENLVTWEELQRRAEKFRRVIHSSLLDRQGENTINFLSRAQPPMGGSIRLLVGAITEQRQKGNDVFIACDTSEEEKRLRELLDEELTAPTSDVDEADPELRTQNSELRTPNLLVQSEPAAVQYTTFTDAFHEGFLYEPAALAIFTEHQVFGRLKRRGSVRRAKFKGFTQKELAQLKRGDFVVHVDYGIGTFAGLRKIKIRGVEQEVMKIVYADNDSIYVNLNFINRVQKYSSQEGHVPTLTKLGSPDWERLKTKARRKIKDIARDLIKIYARRKHEEGFAFASDTHWQREMEASFMYEDTPDQAQATADVKKDMEQSSPMDRLICGDVGFGKTEVAVRAAFKAVMSGKQVAILVPTTILAQQHYNTFNDRVGRYSVRIEALSRFKSVKEQKEILKALDEGKLDVVIGTHRLLSKDVAFKDLGLLVIDEEHRFGVSAKEKLRKLRATVDTLTLTATPIPRTLQFSLMGARDLSIINTPPRNRLPIDTEIVQYDLQIVREAILKELHRGGQVYFINDRVHDMDQVLALLKERVPEARFHSAHGQMRGHELEKTMLDFLQKKFDVLVCTKIIESGIDIPSVNTIIINRADRFGLAELYQLRGRVGRSNIQASAYLLTPPIAALPKQTLRRLAAIQEFTELGSGFNLAMRDLEIRGSGNLLGGEQSGFIMEMGFEMYQRVVEEAVRELKDEEFTEMFKGQRIEGKAQKADAAIEADIDALIPNIYVESDAERLDIYRRLYKAQTLEDVQLLRDELKDRFGEYPEEVENLLLMVETKTIAGAIGLRKVELEGTEVRLLLPPTEDKLFYEGMEGLVAPFQRIMETISGMKNIQPRLKEEGTQLKLVATIGESASSRERLTAVRETLEELLK